MAWSKTRPTYSQGPNGNATPKNKKELQAFLSIINYSGKFSLSTTNVCEPLQKLTLSKIL